MLKVILGVIAGFIAWSILWLGSDQVLQTASPGWYGTHQQALELAIANAAPFSANSMILLMHLVRASIISIMSGFLAAFIAGENKRAPLILGIALLIVGILVEVSVWSYLPIWYHLIFLVLLVPATILGGKLKVVANS